MTPTWDILVSWEALGQDICADVPPAAFAGEVVFCIKPVGHEGKHRDELGWEWHGRK